MRPLLKKHAEKLRFGLVGGVNTVLDFGILFLLTHFGVADLVANFLSTTTAFSFSFTANRKFTFKSVGGNTKRQLLLFMVITLSGLWILQPIVIFLIKIAIGDHLSESLTLFIAKLLATVVTLIWNYLWYSRVVFRPKREV